MYRIRELLALDRKLLHTQDLALAWDINNSNTLYTTISRYVRASILYPVQKGLYATVPLERLDQYELGTSLAHGYAYVSCETVLAAAGYIVQHVDSITMVSTFSKSILRAGYRFRYRQLADQFLYQSQGIEKRGNVLWATPSRAVADMRYFSPQYYFDMHDRIDWKQVLALQKQIGYL